MDLSAVEVWTKQFRQVACSDSPAIDAESAAKPCWSLSPGALTGSVVFQAPSAGEPFRELS